MVNVLLLTLMYRTMVTNLDGITLDEEILKAVRKLNIS